MTKCPIRNVYEFKFSDFQIWDTAGQERFKSLRTPFYRGSDMCLLTFALDDEQSFHNLDTWRREFIHYADVKADFPFMVVGNKLDLPRAVSKEEVETYCSTNGDLGYCETSAKDATGVEEAFTTCLKTYVNTEAPKEAVPLPDTVQLGAAATQSRGICSSGCS
ncbi:Small GTP-binding protein domain [Trinorchestia longiramus]|nr:Small GTP-binding protein domain [Trinorchestia longiramus]